MGVVLAGKSRNRTQSGKCSQNFSCLKHQAQSLLLVRSWGVGGKRKQQWVWHAVFLAQF